MNILIPVSIAILTIANAIQFYLLVKMDIEVSNLKRYSDALNEKCIEYCREIRQLKKGQHGRQQ